MGTASGPRRVQKRRSGRADFAAFGEIHRHALRSSVGARRRALSRPRRFRSESPWAETRRGRVMT